MFAKLFTTSLGQFLLTKEDDDGQPLIRARYDVQSPFEGADAVVTKTGAFDASDEGEEKRDKQFDDFTAEQAEAIAQEGF